MKFKLLTLITLTGFVPLEAHHEKNEKVANKSIKQKRYIRKFSDYISNLTPTQILRMVALIKTSEALGFHCSPPFFPILRDPKGWIISLSSFSCVMAFFGYRALIGLGAIKGINFVGRKLAGIKDKPTQSETTATEKQTEPAEESLV